MNMAKKHNVLTAHLKEWLDSKGNKERRGALNKKLSSTLAMHPKSINRSMRRLQLKDTTKQEQRGRSRHYGPDVTAALAQVWEEMDYPCAENLHGGFTEYITFFRQEDSWSFSDETTGKLHAMSLGTMKDRIRAMRQKRGVVTISLMILVADSIVPFEYSSARSFDNYELSIPTIPGT